MSPLTPSSTFNTTSLYTRVVFHPFSLAHSHRPKSLEEQTSMFLKHRRRKARQPSCIIGRLLQHQLDRIYICRLIPCTCIVYTARCGGARPCSYRQGTGRLVRHVQGGVGVDEQQPKKNSPMLRSLFLPPTKLQCRSPDFHSPYPKGMGILHRKLF